MKPIHLFAVHMPESVDKPLLETLHSGYITQGKKVAEFEQTVAKWVNNKNILALNSGTSALHLALKLAGIGPKDEVISAPMTCMATNAPIYHTGAKIVWADINPLTGNIDPEKIKPLITKKTKAIMCVHYGGYPCDLDEINAIAKEHGLKVIEDAAHAFGATYKNRMIGSISDYACFSLQAIKHITTIDGGLLTCKSKKDYERGKLLRWYGIDREKPNPKDLRCEDDVIEPGWKWHMNDVTATIGLEQLNYINRILRAHRANAAFYDYELKRRKIKFLHPAYYKDNRLSSYWLYIVLVTNKRDEFIEFMKGCGIMASKVHARNDVHSCFKEFKGDKLLGVDEFYSRQCAIPVHWALTTQERQYVVNMIEEFQRLQK